jgi:PST family polysaccharide transporter
MITAIQGLYAPICNGVYPHMIKEKSLKFIQKTMLLIMPLITLGCIFSFIIAKQALYLVGDETYMVAAPVFRCMIPILFFSFPAQLYGWPTLGAIGKVKQTTISTTVTAIVQVLGLVALMIIDKFTLNALAILRFSTEALMMIIRMTMTYTNKKCFTGEREIEQH